MNHYQLLLPDGNLPDIPYRSALLTDFALLNGAQVSDSLRQSQVRKSYPGTYYTCVPDGSGNPMGYLPDGSLASLFRARRDIGIRPVIRLKKKAAEGLCELGEFPQSICDIALQKQLDQVFELSGLVATGRFWTLANGTTKSGETDYLACREYCFEDERYLQIRLHKEADHLPQALQSILHFRKSTHVWVRVEPIRWIVLAGGQFMISEKILTAGVRCCKASSQFFGKMEGTDLGDYLNNYMAAEIFRDSKAPVYPLFKTKNLYREPMDFDFSSATEEDIIRGAIESGVAVFLHGAPSEGKSARVMQIDPDCEIIYLRNATPESLNGKSVYNQATGEMFDVPPTWLKKVEAKCNADPDRLHIVFFDEITNALPSIQGIAFNIVLNREVNGIWKLPDNARIVAAGNDLQDSLAANLLAEPLFNRFAHVYIHTTVSDWLAWAADHDIHPSIYAFIACKGEEALRSAYNGEKPNADPRKWEMASKMLYQTGKPDMLRSLVGEEITEEFIAFCKKKVLTLEDVLDQNYDPAQLEQMDVSEKYAVTTALLRADEYELDPVRSFVGLLGAEYLALFDMLWARGDPLKLQIIMESRSVERAEAD